VFVGRRDKDPRDKTSIQKDEFVAGIGDILDEMQERLFDRARRFMEDNTRRIDDIQSFDEFFTPANKTQPEIHGGFALAHWCGEGACEEKIKERLNVSIRCIPFSGESEPGQCIECGKKSRQRVVFAKAY
jgi:prolyl-tRNA synthetase